MTEIEALRELEKAVRLCGLPGMMISGESQHQALSQALKNVEEARWKYVKENALTLGAR